MTSTKIPSRLLESLTLTLEETYNIAFSMEMAELNSQVYLNQHSTLSALPGNYQFESQSSPTNSECVTVTAATNSTNSSRSGHKHSRKNCPAREFICKSCNKKGYFAKVCRSKSTSASANVFEGYNNCTACIIAATPASLKKTIVPAFIKGLHADALIDTGSSVSFINEDFANLCKLPRKPCTQTVSMASLSHTSEFKGVTTQNIKIGDHSYDNINLLIVKNLCANIIIGHDVLSNHSSLEFEFRVPKKVFKTNVEHGKNLENFLKATDKYGLTLNKTKSKFNQTVINLLGYTIGPNHVIKPDASRLQPLLKMPPPNDTVSLRRVLIMFAQYSKWIPKFSERVHTLAHVNNFPLNEDALSYFENLKSIVAKSSIHAINENMPFVVETDASEHSIAATLSQDSRPVTFLFPFKY
ncbi:uncharacterized protein [Diabrotica undecimpunctata]|uniref:uncharacterized protein n=1 Tax=Diabrotica undecimpunctata TaxID=50387 RepID=UPI003B6348A0